MFEKSAFHYTRPEDINIKKTMIQDKLRELDHPVESMTLGIFDEIGEFTAKKKRSYGSELYKTVGAFFRPNYERGILLYAMVKRFNINSFLEIGFGRGYSTFCAAMAMTEAGIDGKITTVDPNFDEEFISNLAKAFPKEWFSKIEFISGKSENVIPKLNSRFDMIYIDGDHTFDAVNKDWELTKDLYNKFVLFDDYMLPRPESQEGIEVASVVNQIQGLDKELIIMDRRIFLDDRGKSDSEIDYGQVLIRNPEFIEE